MKAQISEQSWFYGRVNHFMDPFNYWSHLDPACYTYIYYSIAGYKFQINKMNKISSIGMLDAFYNGGGGGEFYFKILQCIYV